MLFITDSLSCGGKERQLVELIEGLIPIISNENILVITTHKENYYESQLERMGIKIVKIVRSWRYDVLDFLKKYINVFDEFKPDVIHSISVMTSFYTVLLKIFRNFYFVDGTIRKAPNKIGFFSKVNILNRINFYFAELVVGNSKTGIKVFKAPLKKSKVIYNGFNFRRLENLKGSEMIKKELGINTKFVVGMVASFSDKKDYRSYLLVAQKILKKRDDVTFLAVGDGKYLDHHKMFIKPKFKEKIIFTGRQKDVESIINIFDIGVLSTYVEGISNSIMEYMALGKPVIATNGGGTRELVIDNETGFLININDIDDLANKIILLLENQNLRKKLGQNGKERILSEFALEKMISSYYNLYQSLSKKISMKVLQVVSSLSSEKELFNKPFIKTQIDTLRANGIHIDVLEINKNDNPINYFLGFKKVNNQLKKNNYALIHAHYSYCGWACVFQRKTPVIVSLMGSDLLGIPNWNGKQTLLGYFNIFISQLLQFFVQGMIVKSKEMRNHCIRKKIVKVIPNGVDFEKFKPIDKSKCRKILGLNNFKKYILFLGNPKIPGKNIKLALKAYNILKKTDENVEFLMPYPVPYNIIPIYLNAADVLLLTSYWEGSPNVIKEAMACNLPIVSTDVGDVREIIGNTEGCYICSFDPKDVANKVLSSLEYNKRTNGGDKIKHLNLNNIAMQILEVYSKVLNE
ncbi:MAG: glycosyltransferase family 4 protein [Candidatus Aminicenantia bacterium]